MKKLLCLAALFTGSAFAQIDYTFNNTIGQNAGIWSAVSGNSTTMGMGAAGAVVPAGSAYQTLGSGTNLSGWSAAGNYGVAQGASGVTVNANGTASIGGGRSVPVTMAAKIKPLSLAKGLMFAAKLIPVLQTGVALYDMFKDMGYDVAKDASGNVTASTPQTGCSGSCYKINGLDNWFSTREQACQDFENFINGGGAGPAYHINSHDTGLNACTLNGTGPLGAYSGTGYFGVGSGGGVQGGNPVTLQELEDAIASKSGWPTTTFYTQNAVKDAINAGQDFQVEAPTMSGPATSPGASSTVQGFNTSGQPTTTTSTTTNNHTYEGNKVTTTTNNVSNVTNNVTGAVTTTTTTTAPAPTPDPVDPCAKNPDRIGCLKLGDPVEQNLKTKDIPVEISPVAFSGGGGCPADYQVPFVIMGKSFNPHFSYAAICGAAVDYVKPVLLVLAFAASVFIFVGGLKS